MKPSKDTPEALTLHSLIRLVRQHVAQQWTGQLMITYQHGRLKLWVLRQSDQLAAEYRQLAAEGFRRPVEDVIAQLEREAAEQFYGHLTLPFHQGTILDVDKMTQIKFEGEALALIAGQPPFLQRRAG